MSVQIQISGGERDQADCLAIRLSHWLRAQGYPFTLTADTPHHTQVLNDGLESIDYKSAPFDPDTRVEILVR